MGKLAIGAVFGWNSTRKIVTEVKFTETQIQQTYTEIKSAQQKYAFAIPEGALIAVCGLLILIWMVIMCSRKKQDV